MFQEAPHWFELESELTELEHETNEAFTGEVETTLPLPDPPIDSLSALFVSRSDWMSLPTNASESNTRWEVRFWRYADDDVRVYLRCTSLQYPVAAVRLLATAVGDPHNWAETAAVLFDNSESDWDGMFQKQLKLSELMQQHVRVRVRWMQVQLSPHAISHVMSGKARFQCHWHLRGFNTVRPTAEWWPLWSEPFGGGALWRMRVDSCVNSSSRRELEVGVHLQHVTEEVEWRQLQWSCALTYGNTQFTNNNNNMEKRSHCSWTVVDDVERLLAETLDLQLFICVT